MIMLTNLKIVDFGLCDKIEIIEKIIKKLFLIC